MKLSTIMQAMMSRVVDIDVTANVTRVDFVRSGAGFGVFTGHIPGGYWPSRARRIRIGDAHFAIWGRDTMVHTAPEAS